MIDSITKTIGITWYRKTSSNKSSKVAYIKDETQALKDSKRFLFKIDRLLDLRGADYLADYCVVKDNKILPYSPVYYSQFIFTPLNESQIVELKRSVEMHVKGEEWHEKGEETYKADPGKFIFPRYTNETLMLEGLYGSVLFYQILNKEDHLIKMNSKSNNFTRFVPNRNIREERERSERQNK